jgi:hypothetical protein
MKIISLSCAVVFIAVTSLQVCAQGDVPVNMYTGSPGINIDLYNLVDHDLEQPIRLSYNLSDLRVSSLHHFGVGWDLPIGGQVRRKVRGLPDDFIGSGTDKRQGWLYNTNFSDVPNNFPASSDALTSTYLDEYDDNIFLSNRRFNVKDTEPDLFSFSVGNVSGNFVFGNDGNVQLIPFQEISIVPNFVNKPSNMIITGFTITTNDGVVYVLDVLETRDYQLTKSASDYEALNETQVVAFEREFEYYGTSITYTTGWILHTTTSPSGASITYGHTAKEMVVPNTDRRAMLADAQWQFGTDIVVLGEFSLMTESITDNLQLVSSITTSGNVVVSIPDSTTVTVTDPLKGAAPYKMYTLHYDSSFLDTVTEVDPSNSCFQKAPYKIFYKQKSSYPTYRGKWMQNQDLWGYNNDGDNAPGHTIPTIYVYPDKPALERYRIYPIPGYSGTSYALFGNSNRSATVGGATVGTISRLVYPTGGESDFTFESNKYYDAEAGIDQVGGGVRIQSITYNNGVNPSNNMVTNFTYTDASGKSTGRLITRPAYAIPTYSYVIPDALGHPGSTQTFGQLSSSARWRDLTMVTGWDVSDQETTWGSPVGYSKVTVSRPGSGKTVFDYTLPGTYGSSATGTGNTDWIATTTKFARPNHSNLEMGVITGAEVGEYALFPNTPYDYERGLLLTKSEYNENGTLVRTTSNTYQYIFKSTAPVPVVAVAYDNYANYTGLDLFLYGRYVTITSVAKVLATETVTTYDETVPPRSVADVTSYIYGSNNHRFITKVTHTIPDGTVYSTSMKYTLDYPSTVQNPADQQLNMIQMLKAANRTSFIVEQQKTVRLFGGAEQTTNAILLRFAPFALNKPLVQYKQVFRQPTPPVTFTPSGVTSDVFTSDPNYVTVETVNEYSSGFQMPLSITGEDRTTNAILYGFGNRFQIAKVAMAATTEVAFDDFESASTSSFTITGGFFGAGRTGLKGVHPFATLSRSVTKPLLATKYVLSFWIKNPSTSVTLNVLLKNASNATYSTNNYTYSASANYQHVVQLVDVSGISTTTFSITIAGQSLTSPGGDSPSLLPLLDDVAFYPDYASISSVTYDIPFGVNSSTNEIGVTGFTTYDRFGRTKFLADKDGNIRKRFIYNYPGEVAPTLIANILSPPSTYCVGHQYVLTAADQQKNSNNQSCLTGETYQWDFGDGGGFSSQSSSKISPTHTYHTVGARTVTLRVSHPDYAAPISQEIPIVVAAPNLVASVSNLNGSYNVEQTVAPVAQQQDCVQGALYSWDFGEGAGASSPSTSTTINYAYTNAGTHVVTLFVTHPDYAGLPNQSPVEKSYQVTVGSVTLTQTTCPGGVKTMDAAGTVTSTYTCTSAAAGKITAVMNAVHHTGLAISYQWQKRDTNVGSYSNISGETSATLTPMTVSQTAHSFYLRCKATATDHSTILSDEILVTTANN